MVEIKATRVTERVIGHKCDICSVLLRDNKRARIINETTNCWCEADFCQDCYKKVKILLEETFDFQIKDRW